VYKVCISLGKERCGNFTRDSIVLHSKDVIRALERDGWYRVGQTGSHVHFKHETKPGKVTVPHPVKDLPIGTLKSIEKASGVKLR
jgi:predicted RNA binding protein YcfA (HicA-like mRNA interferase family)